MKRGVVSILALLLAVCALHAQNPNRLVLGVMRSDGVIVPFALFDGDWSVPWPTGVQNIDIPITLEAVPKKWWGGEAPAAWMFWPLGGHEAVRVTPLAPAVVMAGREKRLGLRTPVTSREPLPTPYELPFPKEGLAVAGEVKVEQIGSVSSKSPAWKELMVTLQADIETSELKAIDRLRSNAGWTHPVTRDRRRTATAELESWYSSTLEQPGFGLSYIEAVKRYPPQPEDQGCGLQTFISGWVHTNTRVATPRSDLSARIVYCDREGVTYMLPLGLLRLRNRTHWVVQLSSWEREWYGVVEATPGRVRYVAEYYGGGRPRPF